MVQYDVRAGVDTYCLYGAETTYNTEASTIASHFGIVQSVTPSLRNNLQRIRGMKGVDPATNTAVNARDAVHLLPGKFEGTASVEFQPSHFQWLLQVLGSSTGDGSSATPFNYPRATASTAADKKELLSLPSISLATNFQFAGTSDAANKVWTFLGCVVTSCTIRAAVGEPVSVSIEFQVGGLAGSGTLETAVALDTNEVYYFIGANVEYPASSAITNVIDGFELSITNDVEQKHGCGTGSATRTAKIARAKTRDYSLRLNLTAEGTQFMDDFLGSATTVGSPVEIATVVLKFAGDSNHTCDITCRNVIIDEDNMPQTYPDIVPENITLIPKMVTATETISA